MSTSIRWTITDRYNHTIYLTDERWQHITEPHNHPEMEEYEEELRYTLQRGRRKQDPHHLQKYLYTHNFTGLYEDNTHIIAIVIFRHREDESGKPVPNNYVVTAYQKEIG